MSEDTVRIGAFVFSKDVLAVLFPLLGTVIGGLITYWAIVTAENRRWRRERQRRVQRHKREAIALALEWLEPIKIVLHKAASIATTSFSDHPEQSAKALREFPDVDVELKRLNLDPPRHLQLFLREGAYSKVRAIKSELRKLRRLTEVTVRLGDQGMAHYDEVFDRIRVAFDALTDLVEYLEQEYVGTFD